MCCSGQQCGCQCMRCKMPKVSAKRRRRRRRVWRSRMVKREWRRNQRQFARVRRRNEYRDLALFYDEVTGGLVYGRSVCSDDTGSHLSVYVDVGGLRWSAVCVFAYVLYSGDIRFITYSFWSAFAYYQVYCMDGANPQRQPRVGRCRMRYTRLQRIRGKGRRRRMQIRLRQLRIRACRSSPSVVWNGIYYICRYFVYLFLVGLLCGIPSACLLFAFVGCIVDVYILRCACRAMGCTCGWCNHLATGCCDGCVRGCRRVWCMASYCGHVIVEVMRFVLFLLLWVSTCFDSTLGYPGEGPEFRRLRRGTRNRPISTKICHCESFCDWVIV